MRTYLSPDKFQVSYLIIGHPEEKKRREREMDKIDLDTLRKQAKRYVIIIIVLSNMYIYTNKSNRIKEEIAKSEESVYKLETKYLITTKNTGNIVTGWDTLIKTRIKEMNGTIENQMSLKVHEKNRIFSSSSVSSSHRSTSSKK